MNNRGITLVALVISVIVMIIIAGVSITFIFSEDSVISNSEMAAYKNSITQIEQKINEIYVNNFSQIEDYNLDVKSGTPVTKARALAYYLEDDLGDDNIFRKVRPTTGANAGRLFTNHEFTSSAGKRDGDEYAYVSDEGLILYYLSPEKLKKYDDVISVLDMNEPDDRKSTNDVDYLYAVTGDLRVFIIRNNFDDLIGIKKEDMSYYDSNSIIYKGGTDWTRIFDTQDDVTYQEGQAKKTLDIDFRNTVVDVNFNFSGIGELKHTEKVNLIAPTLNNISGIADISETLTYLRLESPNIQDYSGIERLNNLQYLYLHNISQEQLDKLLDKLAEGNFPKLANLGIIGPSGWSDYSQGFTDERYSSVKDGNVTSIEKLANLSNGTKTAVKNLFLTSNKITSLTPLSGFTNLENIRADSNNITSLSGLNNKSKLKNIRICNNNLTNLNGLGNNTKLDWLDVRMNYNITNISGILNVQSVKKLYFVSDSSKNRNDSDIKIENTEITKSDNKTFLQSLGTGLQIDPKYAILLANSTSTTKLELTPTSEVTDDLLRSLKDFTKLDQLSIKGITVKSASTGQNLTDAQTNTLLNEVLGSSNLSSIRYLQITDMNAKMSSTAFLSNMTRLLELDFRNNNATDLNALEGTPIKKLSINNSGINLKTTQMQKVISQLNGSGVWTTGAGLLLCNASLYDQLKDCTEITSLHMNRYWQAQIANAASGKEVDLTRCTKLTNFVSYAICAKYKLPSSVTSVTYAQNNANGGLDLSRCTQLASLNINDSTNADQLEITLKSIPSNNALTYLRIYGQNSSASPTYNYFSSCHLQHVDSIEIAGWANRKIPLTSTECFSYLPALKTLKIAYAPNLTTLTDMSSLRNLESLTINYCSLIEIPDVGLQKLTKLTTINLDTNTITNIAGLMPKENGDFPVLNYLNLQNNALEDQFFVGVITYNIPSKVFHPLYNRSLRKLYLKGNGFSDLSEISGLAWSDKSGF